METLTSYSLPLRKHFIFLNAYRQVLGRFISPDFFFLILILLNGNIEHSGNFESLMVDLQMCHFPTTNGKKLGDMELCLAVGRQND